MGISTVAPIEKQSPFARAGRQIRAEIWCGARAETAALVWIPTASHPHGVSGRRCYEWATAADVTDTSFAGALLRRESLFRDLRTRLGGRAAEFFVERVHHGHDRITRNRIKDRPGFTPRADKALPTQYREMLRQGGLAQINQLLEFRDRPWTFQQMAQDKQSAFV